MSSIRVTDVKRNWYTMYLTHQLKDVQERIEKDQAILSFGTEKTWYGSREYALKHLPINEAKVLALKEQLSSISETLEVPRWPQLKAGSELDFVIACSSPDYVTRWLLERKFPVLPAWSEDIDHALDLAEWVAEQDEQRFCFEYYTANWNAYFEGHGVKHSGYRYDLDRDTRPLAIVRAVLYHFELVRMKSPMIDMDHYRLRDYGYIS